MSEGIRWGHQHQFEASKANGDAWTLAPPRGNCPLEGLMKEKSDFDQLKNECPFYRDFNYSRNCLLGCFFDLDFFSI